MFASKLNNLTGKMEWEFLNEDYDYHQELARAGFADMLHDYERVNNFFYPFALSMSEKLIVLESKVL